MPRYFGFQVSLREVEPRIWRRFLLPAQGSCFLDLHDAIQDACGWWNCHLFAFLRPEDEHGTPIAGMPTEDDVDLFDEETPDCAQVSLESFFAVRKKKTCLYQYDFGDCWCHDVELVGEHELPDIFRRRLLAGARAFPHEDSGGIGGYERHVEFLRTGKDPCGEDPDELREWLEGWHPDHFDLKAAKKSFDRPWPRGVRAPEGSPGVKTGKSKTKLKTKGRARTG